MIGTFTVDTLFFIAGSLFYSAGINIFAVPNNIAQSGVTGLAIVLNYFFHIPVGVANFLLNIPLFLLAWFFIGKKFVIRTLYVVAILSATLDLSTLFYPTYSGDTLLAALFCGVLTGIGLAVVMLRGATSGGTDIAGKLLKHFFPQFSIGTGITISNAVVVLIGALTYRSVESAMYAIVVIVICGKVLDYVLYGIGKGKMLMVITKKPDEMAKAVTSQMPRGVSILPVRGGYTGEEKSMLVIAVHSNELLKVQKILLDVDDRAFTIIAEAGEIFGQGFKQNDEFLN